jgi:hypothetical protein
VLGPNNLSIEFDMLIKAIAEIMLQLVAKMIEFEHLKSQIALCRARENCQ